MRRVLWLPVLAVALAAVGWRCNHASRSVAFLGDSLTQGWSFPRTNLGIYGQTTQQMADRFQSEVCGHGYREVIILGGTNDTLLQIPPQQTLDNLARMVEMARAAGVKPVLAEIPPIYRSGSHPGTEYEAAVQRLDQGIVRLAAAKRVDHVDFYAALKDHEDAYSDGTHLKRRGYLRMEWALLRTDDPF